MASLSKYTGKTARKEMRPRTPQDKKCLKTLEEFSSASEEQPQNPTLKGEDIQALAIRLEDLEKLHEPQPPKTVQKPPTMTRVLVRRTRPLSMEKKTVRVTVARPVPDDTITLPLDYTGPGGPRFDSQGMVLPHSILGNLKDFKREMETRGELELAKRVPNQQTVHPLGAEMLGGDENLCSDQLKQPCLPDQQTHALQHWQHHMTERRRQQDFLSQLLQKPTKDLLMNQANRFREIQEQRELIARGLPALHSGQGYRVGSEFWSLPQRIGDELSGITATLTAKQRGNPDPIAHIGQPLRIREETGIVLPEDSDSPRRTWQRSLFLQHRRQELSEILMDLNFNDPEIDGLEVIGTGQPLASIITEHCPLMEELESTASTMEQKENQDPLACYDDVVQDAVLIPALRFCGEPARWIGSSCSHKGEVGIAARLTFEALVGDQASSHLELQNEGNTAVYYSWQRLSLPCCFIEAQTPTHNQHFYFNTNTGVILPGDTQRIVFTFKSMTPGIISEVWCLNTHPILMGGASLQVTLRGVSLYQDKTVDQREAIQRELCEKEAVAVCTLLVTELLRGVRSPERPSSPAELYITEEECFHRINPQMYYWHKTVEGLKHLWEHVMSLSEERDESAEPQTWDLSVSTLRQAVLSLPEGDQVEGGAVHKEEALAQFNTLVVELHRPQLPSLPLLLHSIGLQLWRELLDGLVSEAMWLRLVLGLPDTDTWGEVQSEDAWGRVKTEEKVEKKGGPVSKEEKKGASAKEKEEIKGTAKQPVKDKPPEPERTSSRKKVREEKCWGKQGKEAVNDSSSTNGSPEREPMEPQLEQVDPALQEQYHRHLHHQVYVLMEALVDSLCDLLDDVVRPG